MATIPNIIPDHTSGPLHKTVFTGYLCGYMSSYLKVTLLQGSAFGVLSKIFSVTATSLLNEKFGANKVHEIAGDILGGVTAYGTLLVLSKMGLIATPISFTGACFFTGLSIVVTLITIKVVYVAFSTFFFYSISDNGTLDNLGNYLSQPLFKMNFSTLLHNIFKFYFEIENKMKLIEKSISKGTIFEYENLFSNFSSRNKVKIDGSNFQYKNERTYFFTWVFHILRENLRDFIFSAALLDLSDRWTTAMRSERYLQFFIEIFKIFIHLMIWVMMTETPHRPAAIILKSYIPFLPVIGILFKIGAFAFDSSARKNYWKLYQLHLTETATNVSRPTNPTQMGPSDVHNEQHSTLAPLPVDVLVEIASRLQFNEALTFFTTSRKMVGLIPQYLNSAVANRAFIERNFSPVFSPVLQDFNLQIVRKMNAHLIRTHNVDAKAIIDSIQNHQSIAIEGGFELGVGQQGIQGGHSISSFQIEDLGENKFLWGYSPISFIAVRIKYLAKSKSLPRWEKAFGKEKKLKRKREGVVLFHSCGKIEDREIWGISDPNFNRIELATDDAKFQKLLEHLRVLIEKAKANSEEPTPLPLTL